MSSDQERLKEQLQQQAQLLEARAAKISRLEGLAAAGRRRRLLRPAETHSCLLCSARLREAAYGAQRFPSPPPGDGEAGQESVPLEPGENLLELQIVGATLSPAALELLGAREPSTFCTYSFFKFEMHCTPVVMGHAPRYGFTSRYIVSTDQDFLDYVRTGSVSVELHQKLLGCNWRTVAAARLPLQRLLERDGRVQGSVPLLGEENTGQTGTSGRCVRLVILSVRVLRHVPGGSCLRFHGLLAQVGAARH